MARTDLYYFRCDWEPTVRALREQGTWRWPPPPTARLELCSAAGSVVDSWLESDDALLARRARIAQRAHVPQLTFGIRQAHDLMVANVLGSRQIHGRHFDPVQSDVYDLPWLRA